MPRKRPKPTNGEAHAVADPFPDRSGGSNPTLPPGTSLAEGSRQLRPILTLFASRSSYVLRIDDTRHTPIALAVAREIKSGSLIVVTPTDTRVFDLGQAEVPQNVPRGTIAAEPPPDIPADLKEYVQSEEEEEEEPAAVIQPEFQESHVRHREHTPVADNSICGRCNGTGHTMAGGGCPVCGGRGTIIAWGRGRNQ